MAVCDLSRQHIHDVQMDVCWLHSFKPERSFQGLYMGMDCQKTPLVMVVMVIGESEGRVVALVTLGYGVGVEVAWVGVVAQEDDALVVVSKEVKVAMVVEKEVMVVEKEVMVEMAVVRVVREARVAMEGREVTVVARVGKAGVVVMVGLVVGMAVVAARVVGLEVVVVMVVKVVGLEVVVEMVGVREAAGWGVVVG